jgi:hypothetical protein
VPTLWDLLLSADERPKSFKVGAREFDPDKVGFKSADYVGTQPNDGTQFNADIQRGNHNTGHERYCSITRRLPDKEIAKAIVDKEVAKAEPGCILTEPQRQDLLEYLRSL